MLTIIIVNYKTSKDVVECLDSIVQYEINYREYEIIVVDNDSRDEGLPLVRQKHPFVKIIHAPRNGGFAYGNNLGIRSSTGDHILLLNPDTCIRDNSIEKLYARIKDDPSIDIIGPMLLNQDGTNQLTLLAKEYPTVWNLFCDQSNLKRLFKNSRVFNSYLRSYMDYGREQLLEHLSGAAFLFRKNLIEKIGLMDENYFMYFEESDFCLQTIRHGGKILYYPASKIIHKLGQSTSSGFSERANRDFVESFCRYYKKNFGLAASYVAKLFFLAGSLARCIIFFIMSDKKYTIYKNYIKYLIINFI
ncbi:MAG: glycosyltransferase family 2 protein [Smithella sp.]|nr:glycosyltransferase family 2 protein [Smithella sp.]